jgi:fructooligosaccharide transport system substrate-binding protein
VRTQGTSRQDPTFLGLSPDGLTAHGYLDTPEAIAGFQFFQDLFVKYKVAPTVPVQEMLATGRAAMSVGTEAEVTNYQMYYPHLDWGITPLPYFRTPMSHTGSLHYGVATKTKYPDMAAQLAKYMGNTQSSLIMFKYLGQVPALKSVFKQITAYNTYPRKLFLDTMLQWGVIREKTVGYTEYENGIDTAMTDMTSGVPDVAARVRSMVSSIDQQLAKYR